jgi:anthranilate phosphoribosyltransferase
VNDTLYSWFPGVLSALLSRRELSAQQMDQVFDGIFSGRFGEPEMAAFLIAMRMKVETAGELTAAASLLRKQMVRLDTGRDDLLDTCGTGGDSAGTFNISTAAALVAAGAGVPVVKHGNRAASSQSGSADVLEELGLPVRAGTDWARRCLERAGMAFCFAPHFHPAMKNVAPLRRRLGVRTMLNLLGPLANPAGAAFQVLGVSRPDLLDSMAGALGNLGVRAAYVVCGQDGLDEVSLSSPTLYRFVFEGRVTSGHWTPSDFGLKPCQTADLAAANPKDSARIIVEVLGGSQGPARRIVIANAAVALMAAAKATELRAAVHLAEAAIDGGQAAEVLEKLKSCPAT